MIMRQLLKIAAFAALTLSTAACAHTPKASNEFKSFAAEMQQKHQMPAAEVEQLLNGSEFRDDIIAAITRPAEAKPWYKYRPIFLKPDRIAGGVKFWQENEALLDSVSREYGVPPEIIIAIIGVETRYGKFTGKYRILDSLATLAFGYPPRADFFRSELEQFLLLAREESLDPRSAQGSYAGAMGKPQFISSSYRRYAVDHDGDGRRDLWQSNADVVASVANYFKIHGWRPGEPITLRATVEDHPDLQHFVDAGMKPSIPLRELQAEGVHPVEETPAPAPDTLSSLIKLDAGDHDEYWLGLNNFYVITRYNHSNLYAMAAYQLSREIVAAKQAADAKP
jgi:membrane-bound lytic murein transglycosylase B